MDKALLITQNKLLKYLPDDIAVFAIIDSTHKDYQAYKNSVWGNSAFDFSEMLRNEQVAGVTPSLAEVLEDPAIKQATDQLTNGFAQSLFFGTPGSAESIPTLSVYTTASGSQDFTKTVTALRQIFQKQNLELNEFSYNSASGFRFKVQNPAAQKVPDELFVLGTSSKVAFSSSAELARRFFDETPAQDPAIFTRAAYTKIQSQLDLNSNPFVFYFADLQKLLDSPLLKQSLQEAQAAEVKLEALSGIRFFKDNQLSDQVILSPAGGQSGSSLFATLSGSQDKSRISLLSKLPDSVLLNLEFGTALIRGLSELGKASDTSGAVNLLENAAGFSLGVTSMPGGSLFPSIILTLASKEPGGSREQAKELLNQLSSASQLPLSSWQQKSLQGKEVDFMLSPLGIGVFLADFSDGIVLTSSEQALNEFLVAQQKPESRLANKLSGELKNDLSSNQNHMAVFGNVKRIIETVEVAQGNLAMFTGGAPSGSQGSMDEFKGMGDVSLTLRSEGEFLKLNVKYSAVS